MENALHFNSVSDYNNANNHPTLHPLVSIVDLSKADPRKWLAGTRVKMNFDIYAIFLKEVKCGDLKYGRHHYDYQEGTLVFFGPGQVVEVEYEMNNYQPQGLVLVFHPDLIRGTSLGKTISNYGFFSYSTHEALHLSEKERQLVTDCFRKIEYELQQNIDKHSKTLITSNIELLLNYCVRFYDRQFITRDVVNKGIIEQFENILNHYFSSDKPSQHGLPSVAWCAKELHLSANYFGDLIKKQTGKTAQEHIRQKTIETAKERMFDYNKSVSEIAYGLGFKYPQHFIRVFRQKVGVTPNEYRLMS